MVGLRLLLALVALYSAFILHQMWRGIGPTADLASERGHWTQLGDDDIWAYD